MTCSFASDEQKDTCLHSFTHVLLNLSVVVAMRLSESLFKNFIQLDQWHVSLMSFFDSYRIQSHVSTLSPPHWTILGPSKRTSRCRTACRVDSNTSWHWTRPNDISRPLWHGRSPEHASPLPSGAEPVRKTHKSQWMAQYTWYTVIWPNKYSKCIQDCLRVYSSSVIENCWVVMSRLSL